jgi:hypothetical protein
MALTLEQLQAQRDKTIQEMSLESRVDFSDRGITRRSQEELEAALRRIDTEIAALQSPQSRQFTIQTSRGI